MKLVLIRHGESLWNLENRFTGWVDVDLDDKGKYEAMRAGYVLREEGFEFDVVHTSFLKRAIHTAWIIADVLNTPWIPFQKDWRLNERHYGDLQGKNKSEIREKFGEEQLLIWRRSYDIPPPPLQKEDSRHCCHDRRYANIPVPETESLKDTERRVVEWWNMVLMPQLLEGKNILISAHGNSLRALVKHLDGLSPEEVTQLNIPTGVPFVYEFEGKFAIKRYYLGNQEEIERQINRVKSQGK